MIQAYPREHQDLVIKLGKVSAKFPRYCDCPADVPKIAAAIADALGL